MLLDAYKNGACQDLVFVPIYIGYDRVLEESSYLNEIEGGQKKPESFSQVIQARKFLKTRYGRIYIKFHEPISIKERLDQNNTSITALQPKELNTLCRYLGFRIINAINKVTVVTPHALTASAILNCSRKRISFKHLMFHIETLMKHLCAQNALLADTLLPDPTRAVDQVLESYVQQKLVERIEPGNQSVSGETVLMLQVNKRVQLEYYKNNCISFFIPAAYTSLAIIAKEAFQFSAADLYDDYNFLRDFFQNEFAYDVDHPPEYIIRKTLKAFIDDAILVPHPSLPDTYNVTSTGLRKLKFFAHFLKTYFESYWIVLNYFRRYPANANSPKDRIKKIQSRGIRMYKREEVTLHEALSKVNYDNAINYFISHDVKGSASTKKISHYDQNIKRFLGYLSF
jgi:glycerol-3-phosphate O-acyltransferase